MLLISSAPFLCFLRVVDFLCSLPPFASCCWFPLLPSSAPFLRFLHAVYFLCYLHGIDSPCSLDVDSPLSSCNCQPHCILMYPMYPLYPVSPISPCIPSLSPVSSATLVCSGVCQWAELGRHGWGRWDGFQQSHSRPRCAHPRETVFSFTPSLHWAVSKAQCSNTMLYLVLLNKYLCSILY